MSDNHYETPQADGSQPSPEGDRQRLRDIAKYQRWVIIALLVNIGVNIVAFAVNTQENAALQFGVGIVAIAGAIFGMVAIFLLAQQLMGTGMGVLCAILMCVPCISLITLLIVNQKATSELKRHGIQVGFFGTDYNSI